MAAYRRRRRFGRRVASAPVTQSTAVTRRATRCKGCNAFIPKGDTATRLRLKKAFRAPCNTCGHKLLSVRWYHDACCPTDINAAMGYDPFGRNTHNATNANVPPPPPPASAFRVPAPPKPKSASEVKLEALAKLEEAFAFKMAQGGKTPEVENLWRKYQGLKAMGLRPDVTAEAESALRMALQQLVKLVF